MLGHGFQEHAQFEFLDPDAAVAEPAAEGAAPAQDPYMLDMTKSVFIVGMLHVLHNATKDLQKCTLDLAGVL